MCIRRVCAYLSQQIERAESGDTLRIRISALTQFIITPRAQLARAPWIVDEGARGRSTFFATERLCFLIKTRSLVFLHVKGQESTEWLGSVLVAAELQTGSAEHAYAPTLDANLAKMKQAIKQLASSLACI